MMETQTNNMGTDDLLALMKLASKPVRTLEDDVADTKEKIIDSIKQSQAVRDSYGNSLLAVGNNDKVESFTNYGFSNDTLNYPLWLALYNDSWVFKRAIDKPAQDEIRVGVTLSGTADKSKVQTLLKKSKFDMIQLLQWGALFGGSVAVMMFDVIKDDKDYAKPMDWKKIATSKVIRYYVTDRWYGVQSSVETVTDMTDLDFGKPMYYDITFADGKQLRCHHDYVLRYEGRIAPKLIKTGQLQGWGYAEGAHILNELSRDDKLKASIQSLVDKSLIEVIKMSGMRGVFMGTDSASNEQLRKRLEMVNWGRSFNSLTFLDKDDDYIQHNFSGLAGLSDLLAQNMWLVSSALEMQGVLFGDLKSGFSNDSEALERYDETITSRFDSYVRPVYDKLLKVFYTMSNIDEPVEYECNSLLAKQHDVESMNNIDQFTSLCSKLLMDGVISVAQYAKSLQLYVTKGIVDFGLTDEEIAKLSEDVNSQFEDIDL